MIEYKIIVYATFIPEISALIGSLVSKTARRWWYRLAEDSDGDPHHNDGFFLAIVWAAVWCFRIAFIAGVRTIFYKQNLIEVSIPFLVIGCTLLGIRVQALKAKLLNGGIDAGTITDVKFNNKGNDAHQ